MWRKGGIMQDKVMEIYDHFAMFFSLSLILLAPPQESERESIRRPKGKSDFFEKVQVWRTVKKACISFCTIFFANIFSYNQQK